MKNHIIVSLTVIILILSSLMYKDSKSIGTPFPIHKNARARAKNVEVPFYLYVFLKKNNCRDCLDVVEVLNNLPPQFIVTGVVPEKDLQNEKELRELTGAAFPLESFDDFGRHRPWYTPTIVGVSPFGKVLFTLPGVPGEKDYLKRFLDVLYGKVYPIFLEAQTRK